jgi:hypothetical protein
VTTKKDPEVNKLEAHPFANLLKVVVLSDAEVEKLEAHPYANYFPLMNAKDMADLAADIAAKEGLGLPIILYQGKILDGRNRLTGCKKVKVKPHFVEFTGNEEKAWDLVETLNLHRRDLKPGQRALGAAKAYRANGDHKPGPKSVKTLPNSMASLASQFKTSKPSIIQALDLLDEAPDLALEVEMDQISLAQASKELASRRERPAQKAQAAARDALCQEVILTGFSPEEEELDRALDEEKKEREKVKAETETRKAYIEKIDDWLGWSEICIDPRSDDELADLSRPGALGFVPHGITAVRLRAAAADLERLATVAFKDPTEDRNQGDGRGAGPEASPPPGNQGDGQGAGPEASESPGGPKEGQPRRRGRPAKKLV